MRKLRTKDWRIIEAELEGIPVSTTDTIPGSEIVDYRGYVWGTTVQCKFFGHDILAVGREERHVRRLRKLLAGPCYQ